MFLLILLAFIAVPVIEIALFIQVGDRIGLWPTLAVVLLTAVVGTAMLRHQGLEALRRVQQSLAEDRLPVREMFDGLCLLVAGALLLTPGFMTDAIGFLLFVPPVRGLVAQAAVRYLLSHGRVHVAGAGMHGGFHGAAPGGGPAAGDGPTAGAGRRPSGAGPVIDGEFQEVDPDAPSLAPGRDRPAGDDPGRG